MRLPPFLSTLSVLLPLATAQCKREDLLAITQTYLAALAAGSTAGLAAVASPDGINYTLNNKPVSFTSPPTAILSQPIVLDSNRTTVDTTECATYTESISTAAPFVIGTQLRFITSPISPKITTIDVIAATTGSWMFNATATLGFVAPEDWSLIPADQQVSRDRLGIVADAYLNLWQNRFSNNLIPWGNPCARTEGGNRFEPDCRTGVPSSGNVYIGNRRYVIDEEAGSVQVSCEFGPTLADSHQFRLVGGQLVFVHAITS